MDVFVNADAHLIGYVVFCLVLCLSQAIQGTIGFGASILALPVLSFFFPLRDLVPPLIAINLAQAAWFTHAEREHVDRGHARSIIFVCLLGLPLGYAVYRYLPADALKIALGAFVVVVAILNLAGMKPKSAPPMPLYHLINFIGGIVQGAVACGGALVVVYAARMLPDKSVFRATLMVVWTVLNLALVTAYTVSSAWTHDVLVLTGLALPCMIFGTIIGAVLHQRIPQRPFRIIVFATLLLSGLILLRPLLNF